MADIPPLVGAIYEALLSYCGAKAQGYERGWDLKWVQMAVEHQAAERKRDVKKWLVEGKVKAWMEGVEAVGDEERAEGIAEMAFADDWVGQR